MYACMIESRSHWHPLDFSSASVSCSVKGLRCISWVIRLCKPPWLSIRFFTIQVVALPHTNNITSLCFWHQLFQKWPNALMKPALGVSKQGNSSIKITHLFLVSLLSNRLPKIVLLGDSEAMHGCRPCSTSLPSCAAFLSPPSFHFYQTIPCRPSAEREASHAEFRPLVCLLSGHFMPVFAPFYKNLANLLYKICFLVFFS